MCAKQIKSKERVKNQGEVFTNKRGVNAMIDLLPNMTIDMTFLEPTCVDCETEYFNGETWKPISQYTLGEKVLIFNGTGSELCLPLKYMKVKTNENFYIFEGQKLNMALSKEHTVLYYQRGDSGHIKKERAESVFNKYERDSNGFRGLIPTAWDGEGTKELFIQDL